MDTLTSFLSGNDIVTSAVVLLNTVLAALAARWLHSHTSEKIKASRFGAMYDAILAGAASTYQNVYKDLKDKAADGVLSKADIGELSNFAYKEAVSAAGSDKVKGALENLTQQEWTRLLQKAVGELKAEGGKTE